MDKLLITGGSGLLGYTMVSKHLKNVPNVYFTYNKNEVFNENAMGMQIDLKDYEQLEYLINKIRPDVIMHFAALTDTRLCEKEPGLALETNVIVTKKIAMAAKKINAKLVYMSTDYVFDGKTGKYHENDIGNPLNIYGKTKLLGEGAAMATLDQVLIIRSTFFGFSPTAKKTFLDKVIQQFKEGENLKMVNDAVFSPVSVHTLARSILFLVEKGKKGIWHVGSVNNCTRYEFVKEIAQIFGFPISLVKAINMEEIKSDIPRPKNVSLDISKIQGLGFMLPTVREGLIEMKNEYGTI